jgi:hypothetical protein
VGLAPPKIWTGLEACPASCFGQGEVPVLAVGDDVQEAAGVFHVAGVCGLGHRKGRIAPGFDADILPVAGDPVADPDALQYPGGLRPRHHRAVGGDTTPGPAIH